MIRAAGSPASVGAPADAEVVDLPGHVLLPALVNAHCHLDLSHLGPVPCSGRFVDWVEWIRQHRAAGEGALTAAVTRGVELSRAGGTAIVGDIAGAGSTVPIQVQRQLGLAGVSFLEVFGLGRRQPEAIERLRTASDRVERNVGGVRLGLQPHALYSCGPQVFRAAADLGYLLATHLAETLEEIELLATSNGPLREMLERLGVWDETIELVGCHPVEALADLIGDTPCVVAHVNYAGIDQLERLRATGWTVAYCPRASAYFDHPSPGAPPHAYRFMMSSGIPVALGTDSLVCLDTPERISVLDEMRLLYRRDRTPPTLLLAMGTVAGARALGFDPALVTLSPGPSAGILAVPAGPRSGSDPLASVMRTSHAPRWVVGPIRGGRL